MIIKKAILLLFVLFVQVFSFDKISIGFEYNYGLSNPLTNCFSDKQQSIGNSIIAENWIGEINMGRLQNGNIVLKLPLGFQPYFGFYKSNFHEDKFNKYLLNERFGIGELKVNPDMKFSINKINGYCYGFRFRFTELFDFRLNPFIAYEFYKNSYSSNYGFTAQNIQYIDQEIYNELPDNYYFEENTIKTQKIENELIYLGIEYDIGNFTVVGMVKNYEDLSNIKYRFGRYHINFEGYANFGSSYDLDVLENHILKYNRREYSLGIRYNISAINITNDQIEEDFYKFSDFSIEFSTNYYIPHFNSFYRSSYLDSDFANEYESPWKYIHKGFGANINLLYNLNFWIQPFLGMNFSKYDWDKKQSEVDILTTINPYYILNESTIWKIKEYHYKYTNRGFQVGTYFSLSNLDKPIIPIIKVEGLFNRFSLFGNIKAKIKNLNPNYFDGNTNGEYTGEITQNLSWRFGYGIGIGVRYRIHRFKIKPIVSYYKHFKEFPYQKNEFSINSIGKNKEIQTENNKSYHSKMKIKYYSIGIGIEYDL